MEVALPIEAVGCERDAEAIGPLQRQQVAARAPLLARSQRCPRQKAEVQSVQTKEANRVESGDEFLEVPGHRAYRSASL